MEQIELSDFISNTLVQIATGVRDANAKLKNSEKNQYEVFNLRHNLGDSEKIPGIKFDVAVTAENKQKDKAGFFVTLVNIGGGASTEKANENSLVHRIQFEVGVADTWQ